MASLFKRKGNYYIQFCDQYQKKQYSLSTRRITTARQKLRKLEAAHEAGTYDPYTQHPDVIFKGRGSKARVLPLEEKVKLFLDSRQHLKWKTRRNYQYVLDRLKEKEGNLDAVMKGMSLTSQHTLKRHLTVFYKWQVEQDMLEENPCDKIVLQKQVKKKPHYFTKKEVESICKKIRENKPTEAKWLAPMIVFTCYTGLRLREVCGLRWIQIQNNHIAFAEGATKSGREELVYMPEKARLQLELMNRSEDYVFGGYHADYVTHRFHFWRKKAKVMKGSFHTLRHTCASWMAMSGTSAPVIQKHLRHSSLAVTELYMHLSDESIARQVNSAFERLDNDKKTRDQGKP